MPKTPRTAAPTAARAAFAFSLVLMLMIAPNAVVNVSGADHARSAATDAASLSVAGALALLVLAAYAHYARKALR